MGDHASDLLCNNVPWGFSVSRRHRSLKIGLVLAAIVCSISGCSVDSGPSIPTEAEARSLLSRAYDVRGNSAQLCDMASSFGNCQAIIQDAGAAPSSPPEVVCTQPYEGQGDLSPGLLVRAVTEGDSGADVLFETLAIDTAEGTKLMNVVYWVTSHVSGDGTSDNIVDLTC